MKRKLKIRKDFRARLNNPTFSQVQWTCQILFDIFKTESISIFRRGILQEDQEIQRQRKSLPVYKSNQNPAKIVEKEN
jgi:hypothetical protein